MSKKLYVSAGLAVCGVLAFSALPLAHAKPPAKARRATMQLASSGGMIPNAETGFEKSLLGIRILQSYKVALAKLGQPYRILRADEYVEIVYDYDVKGNPTGGVNDVTSGGDVQKDTPGGSGSPADAPPPGDNTGDPNADPAAGGPNAGTPGSPPNGGLNGAGDEKPLETFGQSGGFTWVYLYKAEKKAYILFFNHDGRLLEISEVGLGIGSPTRRGVNLGSPLSEVYQKYGWPDSVQENKEDMQLFYDIKHHCQFDVVKNKVTGISVVLAEGDENPQNQESGRWRQRRRRERWWRRRRRRWLSQAANASRRSGLTAPLMQSNKACFQLEAGLV